MTHLRKFAWIIVSIIAISLFIMIFIKPSNDKHNMSIINANVSALTNGETQQWAVGYTEGEVKIKGEGKKKCCVKGEDNDLCNLSLIRCVVYENN